jgi:hypothetical protein
MPEHFLHMPEHAQTCLYKPTHACTTEELPSRSGGTRGRGDVGTRRRGDVGTWGRGDAETRRRGDVETRGRGDAGTGLITRSPVGGLAHATWSPIAGPAPFDVPKHRGRGVGSWPRPAYCFQFRVGKLLVNRGLVRKDDV